MAGLDAYIEPLIKQHFQNEGQRKPNTVGFERTNLQFLEAQWPSHTQDSSKHKGITRKVALEDTSGSSGSVSVSLTPAAISYRIHITAGRFADKSKKVELQLPDTDVFTRFDSVEIDANKEKTEAIQKELPISVVNEPLKTFKKATVQGRTNIFEGTFKCVAHLSGKVITDIGEVSMRELVINLNSREQLPGQFFGQGNSLCWKVEGIAEFTLDGENIAVVSQT